MSGHNSLGRVLSGSPGTSSGEEREAPEKKEEKPASAELSPSTPPSSTAKAYGDQEIWQKLSPKTTQQVAGMLSCGFTFPEIIAFMRQRRQDIATEQGTAEPEAFGKPRVGWKATLHAKDPENAEISIRSYLEAYGEEDAQIYLGDKTPMVERYLEAGMACRAAFESGALNMKSGDFAPCSVNGRLAGTFQIAWSSETTLNGYRCTGRIGSKPIPLTGAVFTPGPSSSDSSASSSSAPTSEAAGIWLHTPPEVIPEILAHVASLQAELFPQAVDEHGYIEVAENTDPGKAVTLVARIAWWTCHAMPQVRGSASMVEWYVEAALQQCKVNLGKRIASLDLAAFRMSEDDFAKNFCDMFKSDFKFPAPTSSGASSPSPSPSVSTSGSQPPDAAMERELAALRRLRANNCLIDAIAAASGLAAPTDEQLIEIRGQLNNIGQMMVASPNTLRVICAVLHVTRPIVVRYPAPIPAENFDGAGTPIYIRHTGAAHFVGDRA